MITIRFGILETNSSSVHAICIDKESIYQHEDGTYAVRYDGWTPMKFRLGKYGWEFKKVDTPSYLWTYINSYVEDADTLNMIRKELRELLRKYLDKDTKIIFDPRSKGYSRTYESYWDSYIDHVNSCDRLFNKMFNKDWTIKDEDLLVRYLLGWNSCVFTGNDNECMDPKEVIKSRSDQYSVYFKRN